jgi:hypothetical protein
MSLVVVVKIITRIESCALIHWVSVTFQIYKVVTESWNSAQVGGVRVQARLGTGGI